MKIAKLFPLFFLSLVSCETPRDYFNRPNATLCIANNDGTAFCNGEQVEAANMVCTFPDDYYELQGYYNNKEYRLYKCLRFGRCN